MRHIQTLGSLTLSGAVKSSLATVCSALPRPALLCSDGNMLSVDSRAKTEIHAFQQFYFNCGATKCRSQCSSKRRGEEDLTNFISPVSVVMILESITSLAIFN